LLRLRSRAARGSESVDAVADEVIVCASGAHAGIESPPPVTIVRREPLRFIVEIPDDSREKATIVPSGETAGCVSAARVLVSRTVRDPSADVA
jgi:hypothetical protein